MSLASTQLRHLAAELKTGPFGSALSADEYVDEGIPLVNPSDLRFGRICAESAVRVPESVAERMGPYRLREGDVVLARRGELGRYGIVNKVEQGYLCGTGSLLVRPNAQLSSRFLGYLLETKAARDWLSLQSVGSTMENLSEAILARLPVPSLPSPQQERIANFLDEKTARIDALIAEKERLRNKLGEYRGSLISAAVTGRLNPEVLAGSTDSPEVRGKALNESPLGDEGGGGVKKQLTMPVGWAWSKVKYEADFFTGWTPPTGTSEFFEGENLWANISDLGPRELVDTAKRISDEAVRLSSIRCSPEGSVLFSFKLSIGQVSFAARDMYTNEAIATFPPQRGIDSRWAYWAFPLFIPENAGENIYGAKLLNQQLIRSAALLVPPLADQTRIANFLDEKTALIDSLVNNVSGHISLLREYRSSLISAAVTGQLNIDDVKVGQLEAA